MSVCFLTSLTAETQEPSRYRNSCKKGANVQFLMWIPLVQQTLISSLLFPVYTFTNKVPKMYFPQDEKKNIKSNIWIKYFTVFRTKIITIKKIFFSPNANSIFHLLAFHAVHAAILFFRFKSNLLSQSQSMWKVSTAPWPAPEGAVGSRKHWVIKPPQVQLLILSAKQGGNGYH